MGSLAVLAVVVVFSLWGVAAVSLLASFLGFRLAGAVFGAISVAAGVWLLCILPYAPLLGCINILCGAVSIGRYNNREKK